MLFTIYEVAYKGRLRIRWNVRKNFRITCVLGRLWFGCFPQNLSLGCPHIHVFPQGWPEALLASSLNILSTAECLWSTSCGPGTVQGAGIEVSKGMAALPGAPGAEEASLHQALALVKEW